MSDYGFEATNYRGQVLVSDKTKNLHFFEKATLISVYNDDITDSRLSYTVSSIYYTYHTTCKSVPFPFFTLSGANTSTGITRIYGTANSWYIEVLVGSYYGNPVGSDIPAPTVYVFADLTGRPTNIPNNNYGMIVYGQNGSTDTPTFDSRYSPLIIAGGYLAQPPGSPFDNELVAQPGTAYYDGRGLPISSHASGLSYNSAEILNDFSVKNSTFLANSTHVSGIAKPIYCYSAAGQCEREVSFSGVAPWDERVLGFGSSGQFDSTCTYWYMYRSSIRVANDNSLVCTWLPSKRGFIGGYKRSEYGGLSFGGLLAGLAVGALTGNPAAVVAFGAVGAVGFQSDGTNYSSQNGSPAYNNLTLNLNPTTVLVSDGSFYD